MTSDSSVFRKLVNPGSLTALEGELALDKKRLDEVSETYESLRVELKSLIDSVQRKEGLVRAIRDALPADGEHASFDGGSDGKAMSKREIAVEVIGGSARPLFPREVRRIAIEKGWLAPDKAAANQLSVAMAKATHSGALVRDDDGRYGLPPRG